MMMCLSALLFFPNISNSSRDIVFVVIRSYVTGILEHRNYPHDTLVYNLPFLEGDTSGHVIDRSLRMGGHPP